MTQNGTYITIRILKLTKNTQHNNKNKITLIQPRNKTYNTYKTVNLTYLPPEFHRKSLTADVVNNKFLFINFLKNCNIILF
jgi:hypothetical protein